MVAEARQQGDIQPYLSSPGHIFTAIQIWNEHPFFCKENVVYTLTADLNLNTEILNALLERRYINSDELMSAPRQIGDIIVSEHNKKKLFGIIIKNHIDDKVMKKDVSITLKTLRALATKFQITSLGIIRDLAILSPSEWRMLIEQGNILFKKLNITIVFFKNNLPIPPVEERYKLIKEFHESTAAGHKGQLRSYDRLASQFYWRGMQSDVRAFVRGCPDCQIKKLDRKKTRLPLIITDTSSRSFVKLCCDFVGPLKPNALGQQYILTLQDNLSKYAIFIPTIDATAEEVARGILERFIAYFGPPETLLTDNGAHFINKLIHQFNKLFGTEHHKTAAYHSQSNGSIKIMHHVLKEYIKM